MTRSGKDDASAGVAASPWPPHIPDHALLQRIAHGAYGEVWMARSALGQLRAVKIVRRDHFAGSRPFDRELEGVRRFEPVSRTHEGLIDVLHVGQDAADSYFYYVMELADAVEAEANADVEGEREPAATQKGVVQPSEKVIPAQAMEYAPRTLRQELERRGHLTVAECIELGMALCEALDHLHQCGLVHRDVKPSNILYVNGTPRLADAGLVAVSDEQHSLVGTDGYVPPEGPGRVQADLFSLGRVLYEAATGKHREHYPEPPTDLEALPERTGLIELDQVLWLACHPDPSKRYASACAMREDLVFLRRGGSLRRLRATERRLAQALTIAAVAGVVLVLALGGFLLERHRSGRLETLAEESRQREVRLNVVSGTHLLNEGDYLGALLWYVQALRLARTPEEEMIQRYRIGLSLHQTPLLHRIGHHDDAINHLEFSADGSLFLTTSEDGTAAVWETESGREVTRLRGHSAGISHASFSPDGERVVTASDDGTARIWETRTGTPLAPPLEHDNAVWTAVFSPDGRWVATASKDFTARVWDAATGNARFPSMVHQHRVNVAVFSPDGELLLTASDDGTARLWSAHDGLAASTPMVHSGRVRWAAFSGDGQRVVTGSQSGEARVWRTEDGAPVSPPVRHEGPVRYVRFSPDGRRVLSVGGEHVHSGEVRVWDPETGTAAWRPKLFAAHVSHGAFSPDGRWIAIACADRTAALYATESGRRLGAVLHHDQPVWAIQISPDGSRLLIAGQERLWRLWDVSPLRNQMAAPLIGLAHNQTDFTPPAWQVRTNLMLREPPLDHLPICISPDGRRYLAAVPADPNASFDLRRSMDGAVIGETLRTQGSLSWAGFSPDGNTVVTLTLGGEARLWDAHTGAPLAPAMHHVHPLRWSAFSPDGSLLATGSGSFASGEGEARVWDARTGEPRTPWLPVEGHVQQVAFSPDGRWLVTTSSCEERRPHAARLWDPDTGLPVGQPMQHEDGVSSVAFSPDGRWIATGGDEGVIKVWTADGSGPVAGRLFHRRGVGHLGFTADGLLLGTASVDGTARFWDWRTGQPVGPPFAAPHSSFNFAMSPDQSELLLNSTERRVWFYRMNPDTRPVDELERLIRFMAGATIDEIGHRAPLSTRELLDLGLGFAGLPDARP